MDRLQPFGQKIVYDPVRSPLSQPDQQGLPQQVISPSLISKRLLKIYEWMK